MDTPFNERGVSVTRNALSAAGQVFPLREIKDVRVVTVQKNKLVPWAISLIGAVGLVVGGMFASPAGVVVGVMLIVVGWLTWITQDVTHRLMVQTAGSEREALSSIDLTFVERVAQTVRDALASATAATATATAPKSQ
ncbi:DUF6232 family protein [Paraburkholderia hospita]|uniref:DUF6232 family protein n=1 Tax=Paraburkholderia hospita TaxID=169430 RepID=UPI000DEFA180|nr:DUF6232 family protein [Paraburkholderia hospita]AXF00882.1 hypothetical protein CUJ88_20400 [Paraburkholderia hospita]